MEHHIGLQGHQDAKPKPPYVNALCGSVVMLEHDPVYTLGTSTKKGSGPFQASTKKLPFDIFKIERAGEATYHGPGQFVVYPILDLTYFEKDINSYLRLMEQVVIDSLISCGIPSSEVGRVEGQTGVWVKGEKIAAMGIKLKRWVTMHGISININPRMEYFSNIVPCGIRDKGVTSLHKLGHPLSLEEYAQVYLWHFERLFEVEAKEDVDGTCTAEVLNIISQP